MYKKLMLALALLTSVAWLQAQAGYPQSGAGQNTGAMTNQATLEGCLQGSNGNYTLTADSGTVYQLTGNTSNLSEHIGHEVRIIGTIPGSTSASTPSAATPGASQQTMLEVKSVKHISKTCTSKAK